jgi:hypothetical protein
MNIEKKDQINTYFTFLSSDRRARELFTTLKRNQQLREHIKKSIQEGDTEVSDLEIDNFIKENVIPRMEESGLADKIIQDYLRIKEERMNKKF